ncbi:MAG: GDP-mannose 4,6-dehydratase, partial [Desulfobacterales bacterium]|nr:GDP-mannose 4,6-dehydratase [Desulfobacterales bacterium]
MRRLQRLDQPDFIPVFEDYGHFTGKSVGLTGYEGTLGSILHSRLSEHDIRVEPYLGDITDMSRLESWFREYRFDYFFHFAAIVPVHKVTHNRMGAYETNAIGTYNICKQVISNQPYLWLFLASSSHVYRPCGIQDKNPITEEFSLEPNTFYGVSKLVGEQISRPILDAYNVSYCIGRIFSFSSVRQKGSYLVPTLERKIKQLPDNGVLEVINGKSLRDMVDAETVIDCLLYLAKGQFEGTLNIGSGIGMDVESIARHIALRLKKR